MKREHFKKAIQNFKKKHGITEPISVSAPFTHVDYDKKVMYHNKGSDKGVLFFTDGTYRIKNHQKSISV